MFREILDHPAPKSLIITSVDSRVVASRVFRAEPGAYFMLRNPGNFLQKYQESQDQNVSLPSDVPASLELACYINNCDTVAVVGHSDCKTCHLLYTMRKNLDELDEKSAYKYWIKTQGRDTVEKFLEFEKSNFKKPLKFLEGTSRVFEAYIDPENKFDVKEKFSQINTLEQLKNVSGYQFLRKRLDKKEIISYALWMDVFTSDVYMFSYKEKQFVKLDENSYEKLYKECGPIPTKN